MSEALATHPPSHPLTHLSSIHAPTTHPEPGSPPTFIRRTPASPWIPVDRHGHC